jgi:importin-5
LVPSIWFPLTGWYLTTIDDRWPELLGALFQLSQASDADKRETAFRVFATTPSIIEKQHEDPVIQAFQKGFKDDAVLVSPPFVRY